MATPIEPNQNQQTHNNTEKHVHTKTRAPPQRRKSNIFGIKRAGTSLEPTQIADRGFSHRYVVRKPRALQFSYNGQLIKTPSHVEEIKPTDSGHAEGATIRTADNAALQRSRLDLFIDLVWVGIIGALADSFGLLAFEGTNISYGNALLAYIVLFLPAWRIWNILRDLLNHFFIEDLIQRYFIVWILMLMFVYGNSAPSLLEVSEDGEISSPGARTLVVVYLITKASFLIIEALYSVAIPWLRKLVFVAWLLALPSVGLWVGGLYVKWPGQAGLFLAAAFLEYATFVFLSSPESDVLLGKGYRKAHDPEHLIERVSSFFIIFLGAGVFLLISGSPCGPGVTEKVGTGVQALFIFYSLNLLYYNGAQDLKSIHAVKRVWWRKNLWQFLHITLMAPLLIFGAAAKYLVINATFDPKAEEHAAQESQGEPHAARMMFRRETEAEPSSHLLHVARWSASISLSITLASMTIMAMLHRSLDKPGTLRVNNRYVRLALRPVAIVAILCVSIVNTWKSAAFMGVITAILWILVLWEWTAGRVRGGGFLEPWNTKEREDDE